MSRTLRLDGRLASAAAYVRGGPVADVGTDHAYLPAYLVQSGKSCRAVAADINEGPLRRARETVREYGLEGKIDTVLCDGLSALKPYSPEDIIIFGMGGELIKSIIGAAPWTRSHDIRLILQPMSHRAELREWLLAEGYEIIDEATSLADGRIYQTVCAEYRGGERERYSPAELLVGKHNIARADKLTEQYIHQVYSTYKTRLCGKMKAGADDSYERAVLAELDQIIKKFEEMGV